MELGLVGATGILSGTQACGYYRYKKWDSGLCMLEVYKFGLGLVDATGILSGTLAC